MRECQSRAIDASHITSKIRLAGWLVFAFLSIAMGVIISLSLGPRYIPVATLIDIFRSGDGSSTASFIVLDSRLPRTLLGLICGAALGVAGALMQAVTRNPLADPGILGVNAGAAFSMTLAAGVFGVQAIDAYIWTAFAGAVVVSLLVILLAGGK